MSNFSSEEDFNNSGDDSQELNLGSKYIKKSKQKKKKTQKLISSTYKKKRCQFYNRGACNKGSQCTFSHSFIPDVAKKICKFFLTNSCSKGDDCPYSHNTRRYPCKFFHIQQHCGQGLQCRFSHQEIDPQFEDEFMKDNEEFLIKIFKQGQNLHEKYKNYIEMNDLLNREKKIEIEQPKPVISLPYIFGYQMIKTSSRQENRSVQSNQTGKKLKESKKNPKDDLPFSIRLVHKNRTPIPQKIQGNENQMIEEVAGEGEERASDLDSSSQLQKNQLQENSQKISQGIELTPESKSQRLAQGLQYYMCSYN